MDVRSLPKPSHVLEAWWKEVTKKMGESTVFIDDEMSECLHWHGGVNELMKAGARSIKAFSSFENCDSTKAVFLISSVIHNIVEQTLKDIVSGSKLTNVALICGAHPSVQGYARFPLSEEIDDKRVMAELERKILSWAGNENVFVEIYPYPLVLLPVSDGLFVLPKFSKIFPILESDIPDFVEGENRMEMDLGRLDFSHLPYNLRVDIRHLVVFFHSLFSAMNVREEIFSVGQTAAIIATELDTYNPARLRRRTAEGKVSLVFVDRVLDMVPASSGRPLTLFDRLLRVLPRFPNHSVDSRVDMRPLTNIHPNSSWTLLPGCFSHKGDTDAEGILRNAIFKDETTTLKELEIKFDELLEKESTHTTLLSKIQSISKDKENLMAHMNIIQQGLAFVEASETSTHLSKISVFEKMLHQSVLGQGDAVMEALSLISNRKENGLNLDDIFCLLVYVVSLAGVLDESVEDNFIELFSNAILEDQNELPDAINNIIKGRVDELSALKCANLMWKKLTSIANARKNLKNYQSLYTETTDQFLGSYEGLFKRILEDSLTNSNPENSDLEYKSSGLKNMIKSGFSLFVKVSKPSPREAEMMIVYVIGGITSSEVAEMEAKIKELKPHCDVIIGSSHFTHPKDILVNVLNQH